MISNFAFGVTIKRVSGSTHALEFSERLWNAKMFTIAIVGMAWVWLVH
jgi:hypothetical protein